MAVTRRPFISIGSQAPTGPVGFVEPPGVGGDSPEDVFEQRVRDGRAGIQQAFQVEWDSINQRVRTERLNPLQYRQLVNTSHTRAKRQASDFNQKAKVSFNSLKEIDQLAEQGLITNSSEAKWRIVLGPEAEQAMFPKADTEVMRIQGKVKQVEDLIGAGRISQKAGEEAIWKIKLGPEAEEAMFPEPTMARLSTLETQRGKIESRLKDYRIKPGTEARLWGIRKGKPDVIQVYDYSLYSTDEKGNIVTGDWRKATKEEAKERVFWLNQKARIWAEERMVGGTPTSDVMRTAIESPRMGGAIKDQVTDYLSKREGTATQQQEPDNENKYNELLRRGWTPEQIRQELGK